MTPTTLRLTSLEGRDCPAALLPKPVVTPAPVAVAADARLNPQPLPPFQGDRRLNPQPLPLLAGDRRLNPQPLPPFQGDRVSLNPQPLPPIHGDAVHARAIIIVGG